MRGKMTKEVDYESVAEEWFGQRAPAAALQSVIQEVARYSHDSAHSGTPSQRKSKLTSTHRAAERLILHIGSLDTMMRAKLFGAGEPSVGDGVTNLAHNAGPSQNADAVSEFLEFTKILKHLSSRAHNLAKQIEPQSAGAERLPDPITFGVEAMISFWKKYRDEEPTSGQNNNSFGRFAELVLCPPPVSASARKVRTALRYYFQRAKSDEV